MQQSILFENDRRMLLSKTDYVNYGRLFKNPAYFYINVIFK